MTRERTIMRGLLIFGAVWQVLWLAADSGLRAFVVNAPVDPGSIALYVSLAAWFVLWPAMFVPRVHRILVPYLQWIIVVSISLAGLALLVGNQAIDDSGWFLGASVVNLAAGLAGLSFSLRVGMGVVIAIVALETVIVSALHSRGVDGVPIALDLVYPLYALALGSAAAASRHGLLTLARAQDQADAALDLQNEVRAQADFADASVNVAETRLHETVLNTLTAIDRGGISRDRATQQRLRERAAESAEVLRMIAEGAELSSTWVGDLTIDLARVLADLEAAGVTISTSGALALHSGTRGLFRSQSLRPMPNPPAEYVATGTAVREVLLNIARHSQATEVHISAEETRVRGNSWWRVSVRDNGRGFDTTTLGFGLKSVVIDGMSAVGGHADVDSRPGQGATVVLEVPLPQKVATDAPTTTGALRTIGIPLLAAFTMFSVYVFSVTWGYAFDPVVNVAAMGLFLAIVAVMLAVMTRGRGDVAPWWLIVLVTIAVPLITELESRAGAPGGPTADWSSEGTSALLFIVVAAGPWWAVLPALASWFFAQEATWIELTQPGTIVLVVAAVLGLSLRRSAAGTRSRRADIVQARQALAVSQERLLRARRRYADIEPAGLITLLESIARGEADPDDPAVRIECARAERLIRSILVLHPEDNATHGELVRLALVARDRGVALSIAAPPDLPDDLPCPSFASAREVMGLVAPDSTARASVTKDANGYVFRLVVVVDPAIVTELPRGAEVLDPDAGVVEIEERCGGVEDAQRLTDGGVTHARG